MSDVANAAINQDGTKVVKLGEAGRQVQTFFSTMDHSFVELEMPEGAIETQKFLDCCRSLLPVFNVLGATVFSPIKADIQGNIDKLNKQFSTDPAQFTTLLSMAQKEVDEGKNALSGFATEALLWLKRALEFIVHLLREIHSGKESLTDCAGVAYGKTLKPHHNWLVRGIFAVAMKAMPSMKSFQRDLAPTPQDAGHPAYTKQLFADCGQYIVALDAVLETINTFYRKHKLEEVAVCVS